MKLNHIYAGSNKFEWTSRIQLNIFSKLNEQTYVREYMFLEMIMRISNDNNEVA